MVPRSLIERPGTTEHGYTNVARRGDRNNGDHGRRRRPVAAKGADIVYPPVDQLYGYREYGARDLEGMLWSFMKPLEPWSLGADDP